MLDQIQTLMLQNRTLLEQTMESKDLFHVEQRQYMSVHTYPPISPMTQPDPHYINPLLYASLPTAKSQLLLVLCSFLRPRRPDP